MGWDGLRASARRLPLRCCSPIAPPAPASRAKNTNYSPKVVADGEPVPRGGGTFKLGNPYTINGRTYYPSHDPAYRAEGIASWYGADFHGRKTANGEVYDMNAISAAHPTMPMPSYARVTNLENGRSIIVRVNDRGPYAHGRIIDLSTGTAKALGTYGQGLARVRVEYVGRAGLAGSDDNALLATPAARHAGARAGEYPAGVVAAVDSSAAIGTRKRRRCRRSGPFSWATQRSAPRHGRHRRQRRRNAPGRRSRSRPEYAGSVRSRRRRPSARPRSA